MAANSIIPPYPSFFDADGVPLEAGMIYVGEPGLEAQSAPKASFYDEAMTIPTGTDTGAAVLTQAGFPVRNGSAAMIYVEGDFSITVRDKNGVLVYSALNRTFAFDTGTASNIPIQAPDGDFAVAGFGFINEPNTGLVRGGPELVQHVVNGNVIFQVSETDVEFLMPPTGAAFVTGVFNATDPDLRQIATLVAEPGDLIYRSALAWARRPKGDPGQIIRQNDTLAVPDWSDALPQSASTAMTGLASADFTGIPAWVNRVTVVISDLSIAAAENVLIRLGTAGSFIVVGYSGGGFVWTGGGGSFGASATGFQFSSTSASEAMSGHLILTRVGSGSNSWVASGVTSTSDRVSVSGGTVALGAALTRIRVLSTGGSNFDSGTASIMWE